MRDGSLKEKLIAEAGDEIAKLCRYLAIDEANDANHRREIERLRAEVQSAKDQAMGGDPDCDHDNTDEKRKRCVMCVDCGALIEMVD